MARRRGEDGMPIDDMEGGFQGGGGFMGGLEGLLGGGDQSPALGIGAVKEPTLGEGVNMTGNGLPTQEGGSGGNTTSARDMGPKMPNTFGLPQGVSVNDSMSEDQGSHWSHVPDMPNEPSPSSAQPTAPAMSMGGSPPIPSAPTMPTEGPQRRSAISPAIFAEQRSPQMFGRADGLLGGGKGYAGAQEASGPLQPTEMFQKLLQMFRQQG